MNVGRAITDGMRADRARDLENACWGAWGWKHVNRLKAWCWWGWNLNGNGGLGYPGAEHGARN